MTALAAEVRDPRWMGQPPPTAGHRVPHGGEPRPQGAAEPAANNDGIGGATDRPLRPSPAAAGHWSITICPIDDVGQGPPVQIGAQIVAEQVDPPMLTHVTAARDMRGDEDALIVPEATIGFMFKLTLIDVEGRPPQLSRREGSDQPPHLLADATGAHDAHRLTLQQQGTVGAMVETMPLPIARCMVQPPGEVEEIGQHILSHGAGIPIAARGGDDDIAAPEIPA